MSRAIIIGYGNSDRRDDGVGHYVAEKVESLAGEKVEVLICHQLGIELGETIKDYELVIFVDSYIGDREEELEVASLKAVYSTSAFTHFISPGSLLALTKTLYQKEPEAFIVSIRGHDFDFGTELSSETRKWADIAVEKVLEMVGVTM